MGEADAEKIREFCDVRLHFLPVEFMTWKDIGGLQQRGHEIGGHTMSHIRISESPPLLVEEEIGQCGEVLTARCGKPGHFAYPYGTYSDFNQHGRLVTFDSGFESCSSAARGCHISGNGSRPDVKELLIRRDHHRLLAKLSSGQIGHPLGRGLGFCSIGTLAGKK